MKNEEELFLSAAMDRRRAEVRREILLGKMRSGQLVSMDEYDKTWEDEWAAYQRENDALDKILFNRPPPAPMSGTEMGRILGQRRRIDS